MDAKDYRMEAALYFAKNSSTKQKSLIFRRFSRASDAIRYAVEDLAPKIFDSC